MNTTDTTTLPDRIGDRFAAILRDWLTPREFAEMREKNRTPEYSGGICASHDYCDANNAMAYAMDDCGAGPMPDEARDPAAFDAWCGLWNAAWASARARHLA